MYVNPRHPNPPQPQDGPQDDGQPIATIPRGDGREQFRVSLKEYQGHPYISLRLWNRDNRGAYWPCPGKGISVRLGEAAQVADALREALELAEGRPRQQAAPREGDRPLFNERRHRRNKDRPDWRSQPLPPAGQGGSEFSEF